MRRSTARTGGDVSKQESKGALVVRAKIMLPAIYMFMGLCLLVAAVLALTQPLPHADNPMFLRVTLGGLGLPCSIWLIVSNIRKIYLKRNAIVIDERGISDNTGSMAPGLIFWDEIADVHLLKLKDDTYLCVAPKDYDAWSARLRRGQRRLAQANLDAGFAPIRIQFKKATERLTAADGLAAVKRFHPEKVSKVRKPKY